MFGETEGQTKLTLGQIASSAVEGLCLTLTSRRYRNLCSKSVPVRTGPDQANLETAMDSAVVPKQLGATAVRGDQHIQVAVVVDVGVCSGPGNSGGSKRVTKRRSHFLEALTRPIAEEVGRLGMLNTDLHPLDFIFDMPVRARMSGQPSRS